MNSNSPIKSLMPGIVGTQAPTVVAPSIVSNNSPTKSQQSSPAKNLQNHSSSSIQSLLDQAKLPSVDFLNVPSSHSVTATNSFLTENPNKTNANISNDTKPSSNNTASAITPVTNNNTVDIKGVAKDSPSNEGKPTTNGVDSSTPLVSSSMPEEKTVTSPVKAPEEAVKESIPADIKPNTTQPNVSITSSIATVEPTPTNKSVPSVIPVETKAPAAVSLSEVKPTSSAEPTIGFNTSDSKISEAAKIADSKNTDLKPPGTKSPVTNKNIVSSIPAVSTAKIEIKSAVDPKSPATKAADSPKNELSSTFIASTAKTEDIPVIDAADSTMAKTEKTSENRKPAVTKEAESISSPVKTTDPLVKSPEESVKTSAKPKRQVKATPKAKEETKQCKDPSTPSEDGKPKRARKPVESFQSPLPELSLVTRLNNKANSEKIEDKEKLVIFYKNEFLAVRNEEGGFYVCQALQNVFKTSHRIRIRWLSQGPNNEFTPDFYDATEFDCILTCLKLTKVDKEKWKLTETEKERVENILKRSLEVEKGETLPALTEEHPDGLDLSLFRDESQLRKTPKKSSKKSLSAKKAPNTPVASYAARKSDSPVPSTSGTSSAAKRPVRSTKRAGVGNVSYDYDEPSSSGSDFSVKSPAAKKGKVAAGETPTAAAKKVASTLDIVAAKKKAADKTPTKKPPAITSASKQAAKRKVPEKAVVTLAAKKQSAAERSTPTGVKSSDEKPVVQKTPVAGKRKAVDKPVVTPAAKKQKVEPVSTPPAKPSPTTSASERSTKTRNAGSAVEAKITSAVTPSRPTRERRGGANTKK